MNPSNRNYSFWSFIILLLVSSSTLLAQTAVPAVEQGGDLGKVFHIGAMLFFLFVFVILLTLIAYHNRTDEEIPSIMKAWFWISGMLNKSTPIEKENEIILNHDYDGIKELDNLLPPWWKYLFYATIVFSAIYIYNYHISNVWALSEGEYNEEVRVANQQLNDLAASGAFINEKTVVALKDPASIATGKEIFTRNCTSCHGANAQGIIGPNLTDDYWINGGGIKNVFRTISNGVLDKGMISWKGQLKSSEIQLVASYVLSLKGSKPQNPKAPQGEIWVEPVVSDSLKAEGNSPKAL